MLILFILSCVIFAESAYGQINYPKSDGYKEYFKDYRNAILRTYDFRNGNDVPYTLVLMESEWFPGDKSRCGEIFIVPYNFEYKMFGLGLWEDPPKVAKLIYHNLGEDKEFCGVLVRKHYWGKQIKPFENEDLGSKEFEVRLPDEIANEIIDILTGESDLKNMTGIKAIETDTPNLIPLRNIRL